MIYDFMTQSPCLGIFPLSTFQKHIAEDGNLLEELPEHRIFLNVDDRQGDSAVVKMLCNKSEGRWFDPS